MENEAFAPKRANAQFSIIFSKVFKKTSSQQLFGHVEHVETDLPGFKQYKQRIKQGSS